ncbi:MAG: hypothetical protein JWN08_359 [Frankiales bacterium]|nr:hypothetical protein [Frankiales bacterium]
MMRRPAVLLLALSLASLTACGDDPDPAGFASDSPSSAASPSASSAAAAPAPSASTAPSTAPSFAGDTAADTEQATGEPLTVTAVRVARQDGFDRVVLELAGKGVGAPGWRVEYDDTPAAQGSGDAVEVDGAATLAVIVEGVGYPFDTGVDEVDEDPALPGDLEVVEDVVLGATFEGQFEAFIGVSGERPFTVRRLADPARVVIDIAHG